MIYTTDKPLTQRPQATDEITYEGLNIHETDFTTVRDQFSRLGIKAHYRTLQSDNYVKGSAGWKLGADGTIEATGASISGSIIITGGNGVSNLADAGKLATKDTADYSADVSGTKPPVNADHTADIVSAMAYEDMVEKSKLGSTIVSGGYLKTDMLDTSVAYISNTAMIANAIITDAKIHDLSASKITTGTLDASNVNVINLNASNITTGTLNANNVSVINLNADNITAGTLTGKTVRTDASGNFRLEMRNSGESYNPNQLVWVDSNNNDLAFLEGRSDGGLYLASTDASIFLYPTLEIISMVGEVAPGADVNYDIGDSSYRWRDIWIGGNIYTTGGNIYTNGGNCVTGQVVPYSDNNYDLGSSGARWRNMYINGTIFMGSNGFLSLPQISGSDAANIPVQNGAMYYRTDDDVIRAYLNGSWVTISTS